MKININDLIGPTRKAEIEVEVIRGSDGVIRINVDGDAMYRVRLGPYAKFVIRDDTKPLPPLKAV
jgi:hypothetical protein